jgi:hypothetical protein
MKFAPIVLFVYNRPWHTQQTVESLQKNELARESELYIYSDAPVNSNQIENVRKVRNYVKTITGFKQTIIIEREKNWGLANSIIEGVTKILKKYEKIIVLEDDIVTSQFFLSYMNNALTAYTSNLMVMSISGYSYPISIEKNYKYEIYAFYRCMSWGWATWEDRWSNVDWEILEKDKFLFDTELQKSFNRGGEDLSRMLIKQLNGKIDSWAIRWCFHHFLNEAVCLYPNESYVKNIGFDGTGVHCDVNEHIAQINLNNKNIDIRFDNIVDENIVMQIQQLYKRKPFIVKFINQIIYGKR